MLFHGVKAETGDVIYAVLLKYLNFVVIYAVLAPDLIFFHFS